MHGTYKRNTQGPAGNTLGIRRVKQQQGQSLRNSQGIRDECIENTTGIHKNTREHGVIRLDHVGNMRGIRDECTEHTRGIRKDPRGIRWEYVE